LKDFRRQEPKLKIYSYVKRWHYGFNWDIE